MLHGVDDQIAQHPLHPPGVRLGDDRLGVAQHPDPGALVLGERLGPVDDPAHDVTQVDGLGLQGRGPGVEAADLQQVGEERLEPVELPGEQLGGARRDRVEVDPGVMDDVGGHPHRRQRGAQLVRDVRDEAALHPGQLLQLLDLVLEVLRHLVEGLAEARDVVLTGDLHPLLEPPGREPLGDPGGHPDRCDHLAHDEPGDAAEQDDDEQARGHDGDLDQVEGLLLLREREEVVQVVRVAVDVREPLADDQRRLGSFAPSPLV